MQKLRSIATISNAAIPSDLKSYLVQKMENIEKTYHCDMGDTLSVILLEKKEKSYLLDKGLEFYEILSFSHADWIHTVWASSDGYSEDIYIPEQAASKLFCIVRKFRLMKNAISLPCRFRRSQRKSM